MRGKGFSSCVPGKKYIDRGNDFIKLLIAKDESYSWLPVSEEARANQSHLSALINGEIMGTV